MFIFLHIHKTGGTSFRFLLENSFGVRHCHTSHAPSPHFTQDDLRFAQRMFPRLQSIAGHNLVNPFRLDAPDPFYMTMLRDPVTRVVSHYQDSVIRGEKNPLSFEESLASKDFLRNHQVKMIAGDENLEKAKTLLERFHFVGFTERFDFSLHVLGRLSPRPLNLNYRKYVVKKDDRIKKEILADPNLLDLARQANALDIALYEHAAGVVFPALCRKADVDPAASSPRYDTFASDWKWRYRTGQWFNKVYRTVVRPRSSRRRAAKAAAAATST